MQTTPRVRFMATSRIRDDFGTADLRRYTPIRSDYTKNGVRGSRIGVFRVICGQHKKPADHSGRPVAATKETANFADYAN
jgi:hypothetical protein